MPYKLETWKDGINRFVKRSKGKFQSVLKWKDLNRNIETWKDGVVREVFRYKGKFVRYYKFEVPDLTLEEAEEAELEIEEEIIEDNYRYTVGTNFSDRNIPVSFSGYFFKIGEEFDYSEERKCFVLFFEEIFKILYPLKNYNYSDFVNGWDTPIREAHNEIVYDVVVDGTYTIEYKRKGIIQTTVSGFWKYG